VAALEDAGQRYVADHLVMMHTTLSAEIELYTAADDPDMIVTQSDQAEAVVLLGIFWIADTA
jgi:hypothetical protein